jgi:hypothetical protein
LPDAIIVVQVGEYDVPPVPVEKIYDSNPCPHAFPSGARSRAKRNRQLARSQCHFEDCFESDKGAFIIYRI